MTASDEIDYIQPHGPIVAIGEGATVQAERDKLLQTIDLLRASGRESAVLYGEALDEVAKLRHELHILRETLADAGAVMADWGYRWQVQGGRPMRPR